MINEARCAICTSEHREAIELMLLSRWHLYEDVVAWAERRGLELSAEQVGRHKHHHLLPALGVDSRSVEVVAVLRLA